MKRVALIDGDFLVWRITPNKKQTPEQIAEYGDQTLRTFNDICLEIDKYFIENILIPTRADYYVGYLGTETNFRKTICEDYKMSRKSERPPYFSEANRYLHTKWGFHFISDMEAEDAVGISINLLDPKLYDYIIVGQDHDLNQLEGLHYNPIRETWREISHVEADYLFVTQLLTGCPTDKVCGVPGIGLVGAKKILGDIPNSYSDKSELRYSSEYFLSLLNLVTKAYVEKYGLYDGIYYFQMNFRLLRILRESKSFKLQDLSCITKDQNN